MRRQSIHTTSMGGHGGQRVYYASHDSATPGGLTATLTHAIADVADVDVTVAELAVGDRVDPAALDRLLAAPRSEPAGARLSLGFDLWGYAVTVRADGVIEIRPPNAAGSAPGPADRGGPQPPSRT